LLLNEEEYVQAARQLAESIAAVESDVDRCAARIFQAATQRLPEPPERETLVQLFHEQAAHYRQYPAEREALLAASTPQRRSPADPAGSLANLASDPAQLAAWVVVANVVLNLDEVVTKE
jgi:hypothetical protein